MVHVTEKIKYYNGNDALAFSDVLLRPVYSDITSRHNINEVDTSTVLARGLEPIKIPITSAGMDTVTGEAMAIEMALHGGMGEIHRNATPQRQADMVRRVKERLRVIEDHPIMVGENATVQDALELIKRRERGYVMVYPGSEFNGEIIGMATTRDFASDDGDAPITHVMTPHVTKPESPLQKRLITVPQGTSLEDAVKVMKTNRVQKVPVLGADGKLVGVYSLKDQEYYDKYPNASLDNQGRLMVGGAIGIREMDIERAHMLVEAGADLLYVDIAHGHSVHTEQIIDRLKGRENIKVPIIVGNVGDEEGTVFAYDIGADGVKVGVGPGRVCTTRNVAGAGMPQFTAILEAREAMAGKSSPIPITADGGIREAGDISKAIGAGADIVMVGSLLAGTSKSPGEVVYIDGKAKKEVRGMASQAVFKDRQKMGDTTTDPEKYAPEGTAIFTAYKGETSKVIFNLIGGLRSGMSYAGKHTIEEMHSAKFVKVSSAGSGENTRELS